MLILWDFPVLRGSSEYQPIWFKLGGDFFFRNLTKCGGWVGVAYPLFEKNVNKYDFGPP